MIIRDRSLTALCIGALLATSLLMVGCGTNASTSAETVEQTGQPAEEQTSAPDPMEATQLYTPEYKPNGKETAVLTTSKGKITVELFGTDAPIHVGNFVELARKGFYDGTKFHRYEAAFVVQGGDPQTRDATSDEVAGAAGQPDSVFGKGGPGYQIKGEFDPKTNPNKHVKGALGMARSQSPDSAGSQFYFTLEETPFLDGNYTVFGRITKGLDVLEELRAGDVVEKIEILGATE